MQELKNVLSYKVSFTSIPTSTEKDIFLTFFFKGSPVALGDDKNLLPLLNKSTQIAVNSFKIPSIVEVKSNSNRDLDAVFSSYFCVMFTEGGKKKKVGKEKGILVGKSKEGGYYVFGIWPYAFYSEIELEMDKVIDYLKQITENAKSFSQILLLTEK